jgi:ankyrin repeat protein
LPPLQVAARANDREKVLALLASGVNVNEKGPRGRTALHEAAGAEDPMAGCARLLLARGASPDARDDDGKTPLHEAAWYGRKRAAEVLIDYHADVNAKGIHGETPLGYAGQRDHPDVAALLRLHGAH